MSEAENAAPAPRVGAYYWLPTVGPSGRTPWRLLTCHDLGLRDGLSHREFWPSVLDHLSTTLGKKPEGIIRRLVDHYYALPRGRVTSPGGKHLILHGGDSPIPDWQEIVVDRFRLHGLAVRILRDEHERTLREDVLALEETLGVDLNMLRG